MKAAHQKEDVAEEAALDVEFHQAVSEAAHNVILMHTLRSCYRLLSNGSFFSRSLVYGYPGARDRLLDQHLAVYKAIMDDDPAGARAAAEAHMDFVQQCKKDAEKAKAWQTVSRLRRQQRKAG
jgi:GntR family transcriptional repressor for pyruvate dehydrogenase complex